MLYLRAVVSSGSHVIANQNKIIGCISWLNNEFFYSLRSYEISEHNMGRQDHLMLAELNFQGVILREDLTTVSHDVLLYEINSWMEFEIKETRKSPFIPLIFRF